MEETPTVETVPHPVHLKRMGRDEMNFAEFPLAALADRAPQGCKTLVYEDRTSGRGQKQCVTRRLTVSASDKFGLPRGIDDDVILALVQISKEAGFAGRRVRFSRYQLVRLLGWREEGKSYRRLDQSLKRWLGVTLYYENAWRDNAQKRWVDAHFHLLDNVELYRRKTANTGTAGVSEEPALSSFTWNETVYRSFQAGFLKRLDLDFYRRLKSRITKRLYRFLDKKFHFNWELRFELRALACEHIGLSRGYDVAQLKRRLNPAIAELEQAGYLVPMSASERYQRLRRGEWDVVFVGTEMARKRARATRQPSGLEGRLADRGVTPYVAAKLVREFPADTIQRKIAVLDAMKKKGDRRISRNPAGYLVDSIRKDYTPPAEFVVMTSKSSQPAADGSEGADAAASPRKWTRRSVLSDGQKLVDDYLAALSPQDQARLQDDAISKARGLAAAGLRRAMADGNERRAAEYRQAIVHRHVRRILNATSASENVIRPAA